MPGTAKNFLFFIILFLANQAWAYNQGLNRLFSQRFFKNYKYSECILNIQDFINEAKKLKIDTSKIRVISITNKGHSNFGQVNAEFARSSGPKNPEYPSRGLKKFPGEKNWKFHVVLEESGFIFDFDLGNEPRILSVQEYFEKMFLDDRNLADEKVHASARDLKLNEYLISIYQGHENLIDIDLKNPKNGESIILKNFLAKYN